MGRRVIGIGLLGLTVLSGCYGSTEPATNVGPRAATLQARGTADNGPAQTYFEYWPAAAQAGNVARTQTRTWPAGASGPFSEKLEGQFPEAPYFQGLYPSTPYGFRVCGADSGKPPVCAQTRTFTTAPPVADSVDVSGGTATGGQATARASSSPSGQNPSGTIYFASGSEQWYGQVTCMAVSGHSATLGAVGHRSARSNPDPTVGIPGHALITVTDARYGGGSDTFAGTYSDNPAPPSCASPLSFTEDLPELRVTVIAAP